MLVKIEGAEPVKQKNGGWKLRSYERYEEIPDLGREEDICNYCGCDIYPECKKECDAHIMKTWDDINKDRKSIMQEG